MKLKLLFTTIICFSFQFGFTQIVNIPDANFKNALLNNSTTIDSNNDGEIQESEALQVTSLSLSHKNISDLTGIEAFINLQTLNIASNPITTIDLSANVALTNLDASYCSADTIDLSNNTALRYLTIVGEFGEEGSIVNLNITGLTLLEQLQADYNQIASLDLSTNSSLQSVYLNNNALTSLDISNNTALYHLGAAENQLSSININGATSLESLYLGYNQFTGLDLSSTTPLKFLSIGNNQISSINLSGATDLLTLSVNDNAITLLDISMLSDLTSIDIDNNQITNLDLSSNTLLYYLYADDNNISSINLNGASTLNWIELNNNALTSIDISNNPNVDQLLVSNNNLTEIIGLHDGVRQMDFSYNQFTELDFSVLTNLWNNSSDELLFTHNPNLVYINLKNGNNENYDWGFVLDNFNLNSLPLIEAICVDDVNSYLADDIQFMTDQEVVFTEYCSFTPGGEYYTVTGNTIFDSDNNGCSLADIDYSNLAMQITDGSLNSMFYSTDDGEYFMPIQEGNYTLTPQLENPDYFIVSPNNVSIDFPQDASPNVQDFCITPNGVHNDLEISIIPLEEARPGFETDYKISYKNKGNTVLSGSVEFVFNDDYMDLFSVSPAADNQTTGNLSWDYSNLLPFESREIDFTMTLNTPVDPNFPLNGGDILNYTATITPSDVDETPNDNTAVLNQEIVNSFDPNDKTCLEGQTVTIDLVGEYVHYLIRFENTGTASAINVVVKDVIDTTKYDISSLVPLNASHDFYTRITNENEVEFIFENIQLPFDDDHNDGYVLFKIKTLNTLLVGDSFSNNAEIYFDFNAPIITNMVTTEVIDPLSIDEFNLDNLISVYPNPANDKIFLDVSSSILIESFSLYDLRGSRLLNLNQSLDIIDISMLPSGIYILNLETDRGVITKKLIVR
ncbi:T9SS type A sorting domain-containing protein [Winogradskyella sp. 3972H.M.0a.05]|uniref:DUF7619 domain-containing protein n=1 Tax=Winogradskyella sp. 3972H.M.0a.05 TaxID=2950277 RepID=UPI0033909BC8